MCCDRYLDIFLETIWIEALCPPVLQHPSRRASHVDARRFVDLIIFIQHVFETEVCSESTSTLCADACSRSIVLKSCCRTKIMQHKKCQRIDEHRTTHSSDTEDVLCVTEMLTMGCPLCIFLEIFFHWNWHNDWLNVITRLWPAQNANLSVCQCSANGLRAASGAPEIKYCFDLPKCQERVPRISSRGALGLHN